MVIFRLSAWTKPVYDIHTERKEVALYRTREGAFLALKSYSKDREWKKYNDFNTLAIDEVSVYG